MAEEITNNQPKVSLDRHVFAITEPTIKLDKLNFNDLVDGEESGTGSKLSRESGSWYPYIKINNFSIRPERITSFKLDCAGFLPAISFSFIDVDHHFKGDSIPRDGDVANIRIAAKQEDTFKDIRMDFDITSIRSSLDQFQSANPATDATYYVSGIIKIPTLMAENCFGYPSDTSVNHLIKIANELKLGFASNIDTTDDKMARLCPYMSKISFIEDIIDHSYINDKSFQVGSIDPHYYLNFVDLNKIFNAPNEMEETLMSVFGPDYNMYPSDDNALNKLKSTLMLTNNINFASSSQYISSYRILNSASDITLANGYERKLQYFENNSTEKLVSAPIKPLTSEKMKDIEEPLRGRRDESRHKDEVKQKYVGRIDAHPEHGNIHLNYFYASMHNKMNRNEVDKMRLEINLETINHSLYRYMKVPVMIFGKTWNENEMLKYIKEQKKQKGFSTVGEEYKEDVKDPQNIQMIDEFVSGFYIIDQISYIYDPSRANSFYQKIVLLRREWPSRINNITKEALDTLEPAIKDETPTPVETKPVTEPPTPVVEKKEEPVIDATPPQTVEPEPVQAQPENVEIDVQLTFDQEGQTVTQNFPKGKDTGIYGATADKYITLTGTWKANKQNATFDSLVIDIIDKDTTTTERYPAIKFLKNGTWKWEASYNEIRIYDADGECQIYLEAGIEGKKFKLDGKFILATTSNA